MDDVHPHRRLDGVRCPTCSGAYHLIRILAQHGRDYKLLVHCPSCDIYGIGRAQARDAGGLNKHCAPTRSSAPTPHPSLADLVPVSQQDVIDVREFLRSFNGDFQSLWSKEVEG